MDALWPKEGLHNLLRERIAALRGVGFGRFASHRLRRCEPSPQQRFRSLASLLCLGRCGFVRLALRPLATVVQTLLRRGLEGDRASLRGLVQSSTAASRASRQNPA